MKVTYTGSDPMMQGQEFELAGGDAWRESRFGILKEQNPKGKVVAIGKDVGKNLLPIGDLTAVPVWKGY